MSSAVSDLPVIRAGGALGPAAAAVARLALKDSLATKKAQQRVQAFVSGPDLEAADLTPFRTAA